MKPIFWIIIAVLLAFAASDCKAGDRWRTQDTVREVAWQALNLADMATTHDLAKRNEASLTPVYRERNPIIGENPSPERVVRMMTLGAVAHAGVSYLLPHGWRDAWQYLTIGTSAWCVQNNISIGLEVKF